MLVLVLQIGNVHQLFCLLDQSPPAAVASDFAKSVLITSAVWSRDQIIVSATVMIAGCTLSVSLSAWTRWLNDGQSIFWSNHNLLQRGNLGPLQRGNSGNFAILQLCHRFQIASNIWAALIKEICRALNIQLPYWEPERLQRSEGNPFIPLHRSLTRNRPTEGFGKQSDVWVQKGTSKALKLVL